MVDRFEEGLHGPSSTPAPLSGPARRNPEYLANVRLGVVILPEQRWELARSV